MPDFYLNANANQLALTAGQPQGLTLNIGSMAGFNGNVTSFTCSGLPAETTCTFNPAQLTADPNQWVPTTLTITTTAIGQSRNRLRAGGLKTPWLAAAGMFLLSICFIGLSGPRKRGLPLVLMLMATALILPSCGGGSSGSGAATGGGAGEKKAVPSCPSFRPAE